MKKVYALRALVDNERNSYRAGDEINTGSVYYTEADYYADLGHVQIETTVEEVAPAPVEDKPKRTRKRVE